MNLNQYLIALSIPLLISSHILQAQPYEYSVNGSSYYYVTDAATGDPVPGSPFLVPNNSYFKNSNKSNQITPNFLLAQKKLVKKP